MQRYLKKSARPGRSDRSFSYGLPNRFKNRFDVLVNDPILEPNHFYSQSFQKCGAFRLVLRPELPEMWRTVQFDGNVTFNAEKVDDITTYAVLPAELLPEELPSLKVF